MGRGRAAGRLMGSSEIGRRHVSSYSSSPKRVFGRRWGGRSILGISFDVSKESLRGALAVARA
jgi:hypothetical protein